MTFCLRQCAAAVQKNVGTALVVKVTTHSIRKIFAFVASMQKQMSMRSKSQMCIFDI
jgi:hypothetical protein